MKRKISTGIIFFIISIFITGMTAFSETEAVIDGADFLTDSEEAIISEELDRVRYLYNIDIAIVTEDEMSGDTAMETADDIYDYNSYGLGAGDDGMLLYVCRNPREYHFTTHGDGMDIFNDSALEYLEDCVVPHLSDDDYFGAFMTYAAAAEELMESPDIVMDYETSDEGMVYPIVAVVILPFVFAGILTKSKLNKMKTAVQQNYANNYMKHGSMNLRVMRDVFLYSTVSKTPIPKSSSSGHRSSSGRSHGGRGGRY